MTHTHLITGVAGQDGIWLARSLASSGERVIGTVTSSGPRSRLVYLDDIHLAELDIRDQRSFADLVHESRPDFIYNLAAMTSVEASWNGPETVHEVNHLAVEQMLTVLLDLGERAPAFVQASSAEIFGPAPPGTKANELSVLNPVSPYGEAKAAAHRAVQSARDAGLRATNLILFGHTSPLHAAHFAIPSLARQAAEVVLGRRGSVALRNPAIRRDWGSAPDFARAFPAAAATPPGDFVIATGELHSLAELGAWALAAAGAGAGAGAGERETTVSRSGDPERPNDFDAVTGDPSLAASVLGWTPSITMQQEVARMVAVELRRLTTGVQDDPADLTEPTRSSRP